MKEVEHVAGPFPERGEGSVKLENLVQGQYKML